MLLAQKLWNLSKIIIWIKILHTKAVYKILLCLNIFSFWKTKWLDQKINFRWTSNSLKQVLVKRAFPFSNYCFHPKTFWTWNQLSILP